MERCCGQAAMVHADHVNSWWGVELLIPLLKHTTEFYFCVKIQYVTNTNTWEVPLKIIIGFSHSPAAKTVRAAVALFVLLDVLRPWIVFVPRLARVFE